MGQRVGLAHLVFLDGLCCPCPLICSSLIQGGVAAHIHLTDWETEAAGRQGKQLTEAHVTAELRDNGRLHALDLTFCTRLPPSVLLLYCLGGFPSKENAQVILRYSQYILEILEGLHLFCGTGIWETHALP